MARTLAMALLAALLLTALLTAGAPVSAGAPGSQPLFFGTGDAEQAQTNRYAGPDGESPLDDVPVVPMVAGTAGLLGVLSVVALRREWI